MMQGGKDIIMQGGKDNIMQVRKIVFSLSSLK